MATELTLDEARQDPRVLRKVDGWVLDLAVFCREHVPDCRTPLAIRAEEWPEGMEHPEDEPVNIVVAYDAAFAQFLHAMRDRDREDAIQMGRYERMTIDNLRKRYWRRVEDGAAAKRAGDDPTAREHARHKEMIARALARRGEKVAG
jgi:hypothetical protein